jgi:hypothetical protein
MTTLAMVEVPASSSRHSAVSFFPSTAAWKTALIAGLSRR